MDHKNTTQLFGIVAQVDAAISPFFTKSLPPLPDNIRELLAKIAPFLTILGVIFGVIALLAILGIVGVASPALVMYGAVGWIIGLIFLGAQVALQALAIPGLLNRQYNGWAFLFLSGLVGLAYDVITLNLISFLIGGLLTFYLLYQVKPYFKH